MKANILIVEDEEALVLLLRYNLEAEGYGVDTVARGDEADLLLKERSPDLVILDWMLPGLSGIELCRRLRARPETKQLPIIMLTARGEESERVRGLATGADDYIVKPFSVPELSARVRALLRRALPERLAGPDRSTPERSPVAAHMGRLIGDARVVRAIGQAGDGLAAAQEEVGMAWIADRPAAGLLIEFEQRAALAERDDVVD